MTRKWKHSLAGLALVSATLAAPATANIANAQAGWGGFSASTVATGVGAGGVNNLPAFNAAVTDDLGGAGTDLWVNNHAFPSEALLDINGTTPSGFFVAADGFDSHGGAFSDIDGDGDEDYIETAGRENENRIFINDGGSLNQLTATHGLEDVEGRGRTVVMVDIDNDDDMDALIVNLDRTLIMSDGENPDDPEPSQLFLNDGTGRNWTPVNDVNNALDDGNLRYAHLTSTGPGTPQVLVTSNAFTFGVDSIRTNFSGLAATVNPVGEYQGVDDNTTNLRDIALGDLDGDLAPEWVAARQQDFLGQDADGEQVEPSLEGTLPIGIGQVDITGNNDRDLVNVSTNALADNCRTVALADYDNDADLDIFGGCTMAENGQTTNIILFNDGNGNFTLNDSLVPNTGATTATVAINADFNNDGWIDTYVGGGYDNQAGPDHIFMNQGGTNHWLKIDLVGSNADAAGAQVFVGTDEWQVRETGHRTHRGQDMSTLHFGLGDQDEIAPIEIQWPDGTFETCTVAGIDQTVTITQGSADCVANTQTGMLAALNTAPVIPEEPVPPVLCAGLPVTVDLAAGDVPTAGDDVILGTAGNDTINGLAGDDTICALGGNDTVNGGEGRDRLVGAAGNDTLNGGDGFDFIFGGAGDDTIRGGTGNDFMTGGDGVDRINGENGNDRILGGSGADILNGDGGSDKISGGNGNDVLNGGTHDDELLGNVGLDRLNGDGGDDVLRGGLARDRFDGGAGNNDGCTLTDPSGNTEVRINCEGGVFGR